MKLFLGIDGGGTRTRAFVTDLSGSRGAWGEAGLSNPNHTVADQARANLEEAIAQAFSGLDVPRSACISVFTGMAGVTTEGQRAELRQRLAKCGLSHCVINADHDIRVALAGGLAGKPGIALIVGTGSSCYGRTADGRTWQTGGWESLICDEGSGYYLGLEAIKAAACMADGRLPDSFLRQSVFEWLRISEIAEILPRIHNQGLSRTEIASFAPRVLEMAGQGVAEALAILDRGAVFLADMVVANHRMLPTAPHPDVVITGGLGTAKTLYRDRIEATLRTKLPGARLHQPLLAPAIGAAMLAIEQAGNAISPALVENLTRFTK